MSIYFPYALRLLINSIEFKCIIIIYHGISTKDHSELITFLCLNFKSSF